jgi:hypothetical protein
MCDNLKCTQCASGYVLSSITDCVLADIKTTGICGDGFVDLIS